MAGQTPNIDVQAVEATPANAQTTLTGMERLRAKAQAKGTKMISFEDGSFGLPVDAIKTKTVDNKDYDFFVIEGRVLTFASLERAEDDNKAVIDWAPTAPEDIKDDQGAVIIAKDAELPFVRVKLIGENKFLKLRNSKYWGIGKEGKLVSAEELMG